MSWFSQLMAWLSGANRSRQPERSSPAAAGKKAGPSKGYAPRSSNSETQPQQSLQNLLDMCPKGPVSTPAYSIKQPLPMQKEAIERLAAHINSIPPMPEIWHEIQAILQQPGASASDLGQCIVRDPVLTAHILTVCNSAAYASPGQSEITNIPLAIARLGLHETSSVIFQSLAPDLSNNTNRHQIRYIWFHSQAIAALARLLAEPARSVDRSTASLNGMLHDIGKLVILHTEPDERLQQLSTLIKAGHDSLAAEHAALGYTHLDAGVMLALHWHLPRQVRELITHHHHPDQLPLADTPDPQANMINHLAHLVLQQRSGLSGDGIWQPHQRQWLPENTRYLADTLQIPVNSPVFFQQLDDAIERLKRSFPDLFPPPQP
ncbi:HDOD domain-containing protein [Mariprofundus erugo]|uniref:HDOD domain-containing protein n=1 Tax=Mariprofundus erugo TaxID=2528639 RepID=UPI0010FE50E7|nr:HDOD domain-containing protein [Mariprofundus erugo]TLS77321.1 HDOD domain-containing protein [Mariprofundus erugo]